LGNGVEFAYAQDPDLLGGYVMQSGDLRVDASLRRDLKQLRRQFSDNPYLQKF
jgi:F0F1-type ATP synthase delta subunit